MLGGVAISVEWVIESFAGPAIARGRLVIPRRSTVASKIGARAIIRSSPRRAMAEACGTAQAGKAT